MDLPLQRCAELVELGMIPYRPSIWRFLNHRVDHEPQRITLTGANETNVSERQLELYTTSLSLSHRIFLFDMQIEVRQVLRVLRACSAQCIIYLLRCYANSLAPLKVLIDLTQRSVRGMTPVAGRRTLA